MSFEIYKTKYQYCISSKNLLHITKQNFGYVPGYDEFMRSEAETLIQTNDILGYKTDAEENYWINNGCPTIFVEDKDLINDLFIAKYKTGLNAMLAAPFPIFSFSFPSKTVINGVELPPCLVCLSGEADIYEHMTTPYDAKYLGAEFTPKPLTNRTFLSISYRTKDGYLMNKSVIIEEVMDIINDMNEMGDAKCFLYDQSLNELESKMILTLTKIVAGLLIYHSATEGKGLRKGFPSKTIKLPKQTTRVNYIGMSLSNCNEYTPKQKGSSNSGGYKILSRESFFRNLQADRYYQGKFQNEPKGSRWVYVSGINRDVDEYTQGKA